MIMANQSQHCSATFFKPFSWHVEGGHYDPQERFSALVLDVSDGMLVTLKLMHSSFISRVEGQTSFLNDNHLESLFRYLIATTDQLSGEAEEIIEFQNQRKREYVAMTKDKRMAGN